MRAHAGTAKKFLIAGVTGLPVGIALATMRLTSMASVVTIAAIGALVAGLHTFGRAGPDPGA